MEQKTDKSMYQDEVNPKITVVCMTNSLSLDAEKLLPNYTDGRISTVYFRYRYATRSVQS